MNQFIRATITGLILMASVDIHSQNVAINQNGDQANAAAVLDLGSASDSTKGFSITNVHLQNVTSAHPLSAPPDGLMVYNTNAYLTGGWGIGFYYWSSTASKWIYVNNTGTGPAALIDYQILTNPATTYTPTPGTNAIIVELIGAGAGGGGCTAAPAYSSAAASGGGAGAYCRFYVLHPAGTYTISIGAGGAGGAAGFNNGANGAATTFKLSSTVTYSAGGGFGGEGATVPWGSGSGGLGGTASVSGAPATTIMLANGTAGYMGQSSDAVGDSTYHYNTSGPGGSSYLGGGGYANRITGDGNAGSPQTGSGGSGGISIHASPAHSGGSGANGTIIIQEYR